MGELEEGFNLILFCHSAAEMGNNKKVKDVYQLVVDLIGDDQCETMRWVYTYLNKLDDKEKATEKLNAKFEKLREDMGQDYPICG